MENPIFFIFIKWIHLLATVAWIGGMFTNFLIYIPAISKVLDPASAGKLMGAVMKRFRVMVYSAMGLFLLTGMIMGLILNGPGEVSSNGEYWGTLLTVKIVLYTIMVVLALYAFEVLAPKVAEAAASGPSPKLARLQKTQMIMAVLGFILGIVILGISAAL